MYKCVDCGHIFDDGEQDVIRDYHREVDGGFYEEFAGCPICGGDFTETTSCKKCHGEFLRDELIAGYYCEECLQDALTVGNFLGFAEYADRSFCESELHTVEHFMLVWVYGVSDDSVTGSSKDFRALMMAEFKRKVDEHNATAKCGTDDGLLVDIWNYLHDYDMLGNFAEWLYDKEVRK